MFGFEEVLPIQEGKTAALRNRPTQVTLNSFTIGYYNSSDTPSRYASDLEVMEQGRLVGKKRIAVNDPLDINNMRFYQGSWGMTQDFRSARLLLAGREMELHQNEAVPVPGTPLAVRANRFLPSFSVDASGHAATTDFEGKNPALQIDFLENGATKARVWLLKNQPNAAFKIGEDGQARPAAPPPFHLLDVAPVFFSEIHVVYDPGAPLFWMSSVGLLIGLCLRFYLHQWRD